ncbi:MAG: HAD-IA family hydrolase [Alphaproteobacteria bacterium]|uniref:HAD-IA family hydrolase n=1 Tax=Pseudorhizobium pelagicum TaxID=1509405 RepID=UPI001D251BA4|nr:HAD-IA family hydrolase [Alphaproteobacteria bacterium]MBU1550754.1 HAD-IA family hydrolase [Alphaproteobacteria bacterium]MBU2338890.1 HAD-IA family hydrolase [Alphaproteobacteria bacterium]MBU2386981.1 HAD-IA family hydrolase [Alphaproteobacteria bacterium]|tara:strand:- start:261 stop:914 length:654 start_codon:yes stop_codon:yes gene_type:complete
MKLVLFDCDGTLVDSASLIHETMRRTFLHFEKPEPTLAQTKAIIGLTLDIAIARMLGRPHAGDEEVEMMAYYKSLFSVVRKELDFHEPLFDGIRQLIDTIGPRDDLRIGAVTGKSRRGLNHLMEIHGFDKHFVVSRTADECPSKPHPAMVTECCDETGLVAGVTLVIGDAIYDMQMAKAAGATAIGVSWGYATVDDLWNAGADAIVDHPSELLVHIG